MWTTLPLVPLLECSRGRGLRWLESSRPQVACGGRSCHKSIGCTALLLGTLAATQTARYNQRLRDPSRCAVCRDRPSLGRKTIIETSKDPTFACLLMRMPSSDVRIVHLVRDSRAVAYSWTRRRREPSPIRRTAFMPQFSPAHTAKSWSTWNLSFAALSDRALPRHRCYLRELRRRSPCRTAQARRLRRRDARSPRLPDDRYKKRQPGTTRPTPVTPCGPPRAGCRSASTPKWQTSRPAHLPERLRPSPGRCCFPTGYPIIPGSGNVAWLMVGASQSG